MHEDMDKFYGSIRDKNLQKRFIERFEYTNHVNLDGSEKTWTSCSDKDLVKMNRSCSPNAEKDIMNMPEMKAYAIQNIEEGAEICIDYFSDWKMNKTEYFK